MITLKTCVKGGGRNSSWVRRQAKEIGVGGMTEEEVEGFRAILEDMTLEEIAIFLQSRIQICGPLPNEFSSVVYEVIDKKKGAS